jgi:hypothetical protein
VAGYALPRLDTFDGWRRLLHADLYDFTHDELRLERRRATFALMMGGERLGNLLWCVRPAARPLTVGAYLRERLAAIDALLGSRRRAA